MKPLLEICSLTKKYGAITALDAVNLSIERSQVLAVLGPNGAGKSTLFGCLMGFTSPTSGEVLIEGAALSGTQRNVFGYAAERVAVYPQHSVMENAVFFTELKGLPHAEAEKQIARVGLQSVAKQKTRQLSKGMLQRLGLAIALCGQPRLLVLDEPFNGLDPALLESFENILREEQARGATLLVSTHTMSAIEPLATHLAVLLAGRLVAAGTLDELQEQYEQRGSLELLYHKIAQTSVLEEAVI